MPLDPPSGPKRFFSPQSGDQNFLGLPLEPVKFLAGSALVIIFQKNYNHVKDDWSTPKLVCFSLTVGIFLRLTRTRLVVRATNHKTIRLITNLIRICIIHYLMRKHDFMWITEVENRNAHDVSE